MPETSQVTTPRPFVFVLMPFAKGFADIYELGIKGAADDSGAYAERLDDQLFDLGMLDRIFQQIARADVLVADLTGRNPNVFYEVGYAHALGKIVIPIAKRKADIPFDLLHHQHIFYGDSIANLRKKLTEKLRWALSEAARRRSGSRGAKLSLRLNRTLDVPIGFFSTKSPELQGGIQGTRFHLPIQLRNDGSDLLEGISHLFLFAKATSAIRPFVEGIEFDRQPTVIYPSFSTTVFSAAPVSLPAPVVALSAHPADAPDGLDARFRLTAGFSAIPPAASEDGLLRLEITDGQVASEPLRLRVHTRHAYFDFSFRLSLSQLPEDKKPEQAATAP